MKVDKFLIIEIGSHYKIVDNLICLVDNNCDLIINVEYLSDEIFKDFPYLNSSPVLYSDFGFIDWVKTFYLSKKYRRILISTGAEESNPPLLFFFLLFMLFFGHKSTLCIRNNLNYMKHNNLSSYLRFHFLRYIKVLAFESKSQLEYMSAFLGPSKNMVVLYDRYPRFETTGHTHQVRLVSSKFYGKLRIGLLGSWDSERRDYKLLINVLKHFSIKERSNFELIALGNVNKKVNQSLVQEISSLTNLIYKDGYISEKDFFDLGSTCSVLLSPLNSTKSYGHGSGSGSIGDAIYLKKFLIIPSFFDKNNEFGDQLLNYGSADDLFQIIFDLTHNQEIVRDIDYSPYLIDTIRQDFYGYWRLK